MEADREEVKKLSKKEGDVCQRPLLPIANQDSRSATELFDTSR
jgi:hypothetical protein